MKELTLEYTLEVTEIVKIPDEEEFSPALYDKEAMKKAIRDRAKTQLDVDDVLVKKYKIFETGNHEVVFDD